MFIITADGGRVAGVVKQMYIISADGGVWRE